MANQATARTTDLDPIDRLEDKIKLLVQMVTRLRGEQAQAAEDHARLAKELDALRGERDAIRGRVADMLSHLESI